MFIANIIKEGNTAICDEVDGPVRHYTLWNVTYRMTNTTQIHLYEISNIVKLIEVESGMAEGRESWEVAIQQV